MDDSGLLGWGWGGSDGEKDILVSGKLGLLRTWVEEGSSVP